MKFLTGMFGFVGTLMFVMAAFHPSQAQITTEQAHQAKSFRATAGVSSKPRKQLMSCWSP